MTIEEFIYDLETETKGLNGLNITNIYNEGGEIRRENLRFYLKEMKKRNPWRLFVGEAPGIDGCFWTGIPFTDINTLLKNNFFQERKNELVNDSCNKYKDTIEESLVSSIVDFYLENKTNIEKIKKEKLENKIIEFFKVKMDQIYLEKEECKRRIELACLIIDSLKEEEEVEKGEIEGRIKLVYLIADSCAKDGIKVDKISEPTSSVVWERLNILLKSEIELPLLWNIYPFHPGTENEKKEIKNRTPEDAKCDEGIEFLKNLLDCFPSIKHIHAIGRKSEGALERKLHFYIRHPAKGGKNDFIKGFNEIYGINPEEN